MHGWPLRHVPFSSRGCYRSDYLFDFTTSLYMVSKVMYFPRVLKKKSFVFAGYIYSRTYVINLFDSTLNILHSLIENCDNSSRLTGIKILIVNSAFKCLTDKRVALLGRSILYTERSVICHSMYGFLILYPYNEQIRVTFTYLKLWAAVNKTSVRKNINNNKESFC